MREFVCFYDYNPQRKTLTPEPDVLGFRKWTPRYPYYCRLPRFGKNLVLEDWSEDGPLLHTFIWNGMKPILTKTEPYVFEDELKVSAKNLVGEWRWVGKDVPELSQYFGNSFGAGNPYNNQSTQFNQPPPNYGGGYGNYGPQNAGQFGGAQQNPQPNYFANNNTSGKSRTTAGILAILIGGLGVHYFYLGKALPGIVYLLLCCTGIPAILGLIQGIIMLTMTDEQFYNKYVNTTSSFPF